MRCIKNIFYCLDVSSKNCFEYEFDSSTCDKKVLFGNASHS